MSKFSDSGRRMGSPSNADKADWAALKLAPSKAPNPDHFDSNTDYEAQLVADFVTAQKLLERLIGYYGHADVHKMVDQSEFNATGAYRQN